jgi:two-component system LytT family response regulator
LDVVEPRTQPTAGTYVRRFTVRDGRRFLLLKAEEIDWIEAASNYVELHARGHSYLLRMTLTELHESLDPATFARIHRSTIVNLDRIQEIALGEGGDFIVRLQDGSTLRLSRGYRDRLLGAMDGESAGRPR